MKPIPGKGFQVNQLHVNVYSTREQMGKAAAIDVGNAMAEVMKVKEEVRMVFAAAQSQNEVLTELIVDAVGDGAPLALLGQRDFRTQ